MPWRRFVQSGSELPRFNGFCNPNTSQRHCYSGIDAFFFDVPTYSWTVYVFTHEMGHLFGSQHTHACVWNGNGTAIDGCGPAAGWSEGCNGPIPPEGGTIMSYCHLSPPNPGVNFTLEWETFRIEKVSGGGGIGSGDTISLQAYNGWSCCGGSYVVAEGGGGSVVNANRGAVGAWEMFTIHIF